MNFDNNKDLKLAVLIDADNVPYSNVRGMMEEIAKLGTPTTKRIYGDWTKPTASGWKSVLLKHAINPIQQYSYTSGKNATDSAMIIDAMDILYSGKVDGFCLVSSDSDFTKLAMRLRESGMKVIGLGEKKTPNPFIVACDKFIFLEILGSSAKSEIEDIPDDKRAKSGSIHEVDKATIYSISATIEDLADDDGWAYLGDVGNLLIKRRPEFDPRNYGYSKLTPMLKALQSKFDIDERKLKGKNVKHVYIRLKK